jgi:transcriptional regulator with XRE-family HTH domain
MPTTAATHPDVDGLGQVRAQLQLGWEELADILGVDPATLWRWRHGEAKPRPLALSRLQQFGELTELLRRVFAGPDVAREWLRAATPESLGGTQTPLQVLRAGRIDRVLMLLHALARGG